MIATATAATIPAAKFARMRVALARQFDGLTVGTEWGFMATEDFDIVAWVPRAGHLTLQLCPVLPDAGTGAAVRTVTVCPGAYRTYDVVGACSTLLGEAWSLHAAVSIALDYVTAPARAQAQHVHDPFAV